MKKKYKMQFCTRCGCPLTVGLLYCKNCGTKIENPQPTKIRFKESIMPTLIRLWDMLKSPKAAIFVQWTWAGLFALCALGAGFHWSSLLLIISAILMMPLPKIRNALNRFNLKNWLIITLSVVIFLLGVLCSPAAESSLNNDINTQSTTYQSHQI